jgi:hypothetical protein
LRRSRRFDRTNVRADALGSPLGSGVLASGTADAKGSGMTTHYVTQVSFAIILALASLIAGCTSATAPTPAAHPIQDFSIRDDAELGKPPSAVPSARPVRPDNQWYPRDWDHYYR